MKKKIDKAKMHVPNGAQVKLLNYYMKKFKVATFTNGAWYHTLETKIFHYQQEEKCNSVKDGSLFRS